MPAEKLPPMPSLKTLVWRWVALNVLGASWEPAGQLLLKCCCGSHRMCNVLWSAVVEGLALLACTAACCLGAMPMPMHGAWPDC